MVQTLDISFSANGYTNR